MPRWRCACRCCVVLTSGLGINLLVANILSLVALTLIRFGVADVWIWAKAQRREVESYSYDIHGHRHRHL